MYNIWQKTKTETVRSQDPGDTRVFLSEARSIRLACSAGPRVAVAHRVLLWLVRRSQTASTTFPQCTEHPLNTQVRNRKAM